MITQERLKELFDYSPETGEFTRKVSRGNQKAGSIAGSLRKDDYICIWVDGKPYYAHQLAFLYMEGYLPEEIDHINRIRSDNRWVNIKDSSHQENSRNKAAKSKSGYLGVFWFKRDHKWHVRVVNSMGEKVHGGLFNYADLKLAVTKANELRLQLHGENAVQEIFDPTKYPSLEELNS
ncbi:hypothetical protein vBSenI1_32 [Salmonella phage vB_Sen_I1]|uniref:HNH nuclease domain-containing protein n=1 Tax=Salmonella phage vB_Sen_I1 TaxID=2723910 RepID=A0A7L5CBD6_9CAUD|nr:hypothetical protein vBSenI1_32 [Salmonella phage vB_Sen_I1]